MEFLSQNAIKCRVEQSSFYRALTDSTDGCREATRVNFDKTVINLSLFLYRWRKDRYTSRRGHSRLDDGITFLSMEITRVIQTFRIIRAIVLRIRVAKESLTIT